MANPKNPIQPPTDVKGSSGAADMTRRMVCGGLAGMIAKVR